MEVPMGRHVAAALAQQRTARTAPDVGDLSRQLYEQIGALYEHAQRADTFTLQASGQPGGEDGMAVQQLADFLDTVRAALGLGHFSATHKALDAALRRYEHDRAGS